MWIWSICLQNKSQNKINFNKQFSKLKLLLKWKAQKTYKIKNNFNKITVKISWIRVEIKLKKNSEKIQLI